MRTSLFALATAVGTLLTSVAQALPAIEQRLDVILPHSTSTGQQTLTVFRDHEDAKVLWWVPFEFGFARQPNGRPWLAWYASSASPRITYAVELKPMAFDLQSHVQSELAARLGRSDLVFRAVNLEEVSLQLRDESESFLFRGDFRAVTSLFPWVLPETVQLTTKENALLKTIASGAVDGVAFAVNLTGVFQGVLEPKRYYREFDPQCVHDILAPGLPGGESQDGWSAARFYGIEYKIESTCVTRTSSFGSGPPDLSERIVDWETELLARGLVVHDANRYRVPSAAALNTLFSASPSFD